MKKPFLIFAVKCTVIVYFAACTRIEDYTVFQDSGPVMTHGAWKVNLFRDAENDHTQDYSGYTITFKNSGEISATRNGNEILGNWTEEKDSKRIIINLGTTDPQLSKLNEYWRIASISDAELEIESSDKMKSGKLKIASI
jgi:hypothetical protein